MIRSRLLFALGLVPLSLAAQARPRPVWADHVILITLDGVRHQDLFGGADSILIANPKSAGITDTAGFRKRWWRPTAAERRRLVMPFLWDSLVPIGTLLGADSLHPTLSTNGLKFSAPGYQEIFTGKAQADVTSNADRRYPHRTLFDVVRASTPRTTRGGATAVAAFVSWDVQGRLVSSDSTTAIVSAALEPLPREARAGSGVMLETLQSRLGYPDAGMRYDAITHVLGLEYLLRYHPRLLHIGLGETDEEAHHGQYPRLLAALHTADDQLRELWQAVQADPVLRNRTAIIITTDHGRGSTPADWSDHGQDVVGADRIWIFEVGAGVGANGIVKGFGGHQGAVATTLLYLLGLDPAQLGPGVEPPLIDRVPASNYPGLKSRW
ncbi:MAG: alkaline phosphatase family protein [Gemmatimonadales bacterium]